MPLYVEAPLMVQTMFNKICIATTASLEKAYIILSISQASEVEGQLCLACSLADSLGINL